MRSDPVRVAVDLETTGLRPDQDAIIEIGAVKFAGPRILDIYQSFVNISGPLPFRIQRLTGIVPADLRRAPALASLLPSLRAFLGDAPLVGHSVSFDAAFLRRSGVARRNPLIDTYEMASMLLPNLPSYTLGAVAVALNAPSSTHHRALADADLARAVFLALLDRLRDLDTHALDGLAALPAPPDWTPGFLVRGQASERREAVSASPFAALLESAGTDTFTARGLDPALGSMAVALEEAPAPEPVPEVASAEATPSPARLGALREFLAEGGALLYELERKEEALIEALAEVVRWVGAGGERAIIAVADREEMTRVARDLLPRATAHAGILPAPRVAELDERAAYLCLHRWFGVARDPLAGDFPMEVTRGLARLTVWARETRAGLRADVSLHGGEEAAWERVRSGAEFSETLEDCPYRAEGYCFMARAETRAAEAGVIVTTHAALAASLAGTNMMLPDAPRVIALDARLLEDELRRAQTLALDPLVLLALLDTLAAEVGSEGQPHDLLRVAGSLLWLEKPGRKPNAPPQITAQEQAWRTAVEQARVYVRAFFAALRHALREGQEDQARGGRGRDGRGEQRDGGAVRVDDELRDSHAWSRVMTTWARVAEGLEAAAETARAAARALETELPVGAGAARGARTDLLGAARRIDTLCAQGASLIAPGDDRAIAWIRAPYAPFPDQNHDRRAQRDTTTVEPAEAREALLDENGAPGAVEEIVPPLRLPDEMLEAPSLISIPTRVGALTEPLWRGGRGLALLGWALSVGGDFEPTRGALGLPDSARQSALTPDYHQQTLLCLPDDVPEPNAPGAQSQLEGLIVALARALDGDVVAIFPSHAMLRSSATGVRRALERHNILALAQGVDGSARQLWQTFETQERTVLLGAGSFWDGAERRARPPACVVVARTPFPAQSDPVTATRAEAWSDPQSQFITPQAALKLRQALGGLAWSHTRRNAVILFDRRLQTRGYGPTILSALPECEQYLGSLSALPDRVARWTGATE
ncbi:MAG TPA: exonuclease domain-containing protein [Ktedonobacterales bacterium]|nr:exonuclease domain-containing protein [Ktedonobacterales bacterium]